MIEAHDARAGIALIHTLLYVALAPVTGAIQDKDAPFDAPRTAATSLDSGASDSDQDGIPDADDNCVFVPNETQIDANNDGYGNACDADINNDCVVNVSDLGLLRSVFFSDFAIADFNSDGVVNVVDLGILRQSFFQPPGPSATTADCSFCGSYIDDNGQLRRGEYDGTHCTYATDFASNSDPVTANLTLMALPNNGAHLFLGNLPIGRSYASDAELATAGIANGGDGPTLNIEAGATVAFAEPAHALAINRGSRLIAVGRADAPITLTSVSDVMATLPSFDAAGQWGGVVINGFSVANQCAYVGSISDQNLLTQECHARAEGATLTSGSRYGGDNLADNSGQLEYIVVKHAGGLADNGRLIPGLAFNAVGSQTVVNHLEVYAAEADGIALYGGSMDLANVVVLFAKDDAIDVDEGYTGTISDALLIQGQTTGHHCIEADGIRTIQSLPPTEVESVIAQGINSRMTMRGMTCLLSPSPSVGDQDQGAGMRLREAVFADIADALIVSSFGPDSTEDNYCLRIDDRSLQAAEDGDLTLASTIFACADRTRTAQLPNGTTVEQFALDSGNVFATINGPLNPTAAADSELVLLGGSPPVFALDYADMLVDAMALAGMPADGAFVGGLGLGGNNWIADWTFGINEDARDAPLWFEALVAP